MLLESAGSSLHWKGYHKQIEYRLQGCTCWAQGPGPQGSRRCSTTAWRTAGCRAGAGWWWAARMPRLGTSCCPAACTSLPTLPPAIPTAGISMGVLKTPWGCLSRKKPRHTTQGCPCQAEATERQLGRWAYGERLLSKAVEHEGDEGEEDDAEVGVACTSMHATSPLLQLGSHKHLLWSGMGEAAALSLMSR